MVYLESTMIMQDNGLAIKNKDREKKKIIIIINQFELEYRYQTYVEVMPFIFWSLYMSCLRRISR